MPVTNINVGSGKTVENKKARIWKIVLSGSTNSNYSLLLHLLCIKSPKQSYFKMEVLLSSDVLNPAVTKKQVVFK